MKPTVHNGHGRTNSEPFTAVIENKSTKKKSYIKVTTILLLVPYIVCRHSILQLNYLLYILINEILPSLHKRK